MGYRHGDCRPCAVRRRPGNPRSEAKHTSSGRISSILGPSAGLVLTSLAIVAVLVRQLTTNATVSAPLTKAEAGIGGNAYARLDLTELRVPTSLSNDFASWQLSDTPIWIAVAALAAVAAATPGKNPLTSARRRASTVPLFLLASVAAVVAVMTAEVAAVLLLGLVFAPGRKHSHCSLRGSVATWPVPLTGQHRGLA